MEKTYNFAISEQEADLIVKSLGELPYKITAKLISNLQLQYQNQQGQNSADNMMKLPEAEKKTP